MPDDHSLLRRQKLHQSAPDGRLSNAADNLAGISFAVKHVMLRDAGLVNQTLEKTCER